MDKNIKVLLGVFLMLVLSGIVYAASDKATEVKATTAAAPELASEAPKNMTYGQCVSELAKVKNTCYEATSVTQKTCQDQASADATTKKDVSKQCKQTYKKDKAGCKSVFKDGKKECAKIKHNFFETMGSAFK
ncbi:MAG: hypothetical protein WCV90_05310 [Candidatus Woesearchaeota archaeon]|jgi:hypothetical protein